MVGEHAVLEGTEQQDCAIRTGRGVSYAVEAFDHGVAIDARGGLAVAADLSGGVVPGGREYDGPHHVKGVAPHSAVYGDLESAVVLVAEGGGALAVRE